MYPHRSGGAGGASNYLYAYGKQGDQNNNSADQSNNNEPSPQLNSEMYPHRSGGGGGGAPNYLYAYGKQGDQNNNSADQSNADSAARRNFQPNNAFADFMKNNDPNASTGSEHNSSGFGSAGAAVRPHPGRGMTMTPSARMAGTGSRRVTTAAKMPSSRSILGGTVDLEPQFSTVGPMHGVAMGAMYEGDSYSGGGSTSRNLQSQGSRYAAAPNAGVGGGGGIRMMGGTSPPTSLHNAASAGSANGSVSFLPNAPYQDLMQNYGREDPSILRARKSMASAKTTERPYPQPGPPQEPTIQATEPTPPASRLGRRILTQRPERQPDFIVAKLCTGQSTTALDFCYHVECVTCRASIEIPKNIVMLSCPNCDQVHPAASCRVLRAGQ